MQEVFLELKPFLQLVQFIVNPVNLCPDVQCVTSLSNVRNLFNNKCLYLSKSLKELTSVMRSGKDQNSGYPKWLTLRVNADHGRDFNPLADHTTKL